MQDLCEPGGEHIALYKVFISYKTNNLHVEVEFDGLQGENDLKSMAPVSSLLIARTRCASDDQSLLF